MRIERGSATLTLHERVENLADEAHQFVWGHHCVVGAPFLEAGCRLHAPARTIVTLPEAWEETARLAPGQREAVAPRAARGRRARPTCARCPGPRPARTTTSS